MERSRTPGSRTCRQKEQHEQSWCSMKASLTDPGKRESGLSGGDPESAVPPAEHTQEESPGGLSRPRSDSSVPLEHRMTGEMLTNMCFLSPCPTTKQRSQKDLMGHLSLLLMKTRQVTKQISACPQGTNRSPGMHSGPAPGDLSNAKPSAEACGLLVAIPSTQHIRPQVTTPLGEEQLHAQCPAVLSLPGEGRMGKPPAVCWLG